MLTPHYLTKNSTVYLVNDQWELVDSFKWGSKQYAQEAALQLELTLCQLFSPSVTSLFLFSDQAIRETCISLGKTLFLELIHIFQMNDQLDVYKRWVNLSNVYVPQTIHHERWLTVNSLVEKWEKAIQLDQAITDEVKKHVFPYVERMEEYVSHLSDETEKKEAKHALSHAFSFSRYYKKIQTHDPFSYYFPCAFNLERPDEAFRFALQKEKHLHELKESDNIRYYRERIDALQEKLAHYQTHYQHVSQQIELLQLKEAQLNDSVRQLERDISQLKVEFAETTLNTEEKKAKYAPGETFMKQACNLQQNLQSYPRYHSKEDEGYIYIIREDHLHTYKIGKTCTIQSRSLRFGNLMPFVWEYIGIFYTPNRHTTEKWLHDRYQKKWVEGEWYQLTSDDLIEIASYFSDQPQQKAL